LSLSIAISLGEIQQMDLSRITIKPRIRNAHEAIDLGLIMARSWWKILFLSWFIPAFITYFILSIIFYDNTWLALLITWWLKPLWDRAPLYIASRKLFNEEIQLKDVLKKIPQLYSRDIFAWLLWRRFSLTRSFDMPVTVLEDQKHKARKKRLLTLHQGSSSAASWLTIICIHIEMIVWTGTLGFFMLLIPDEIDLNLLNLIIDEDIVANFVSNTVSFIAMAVVAPFYTLSGFALYINRRIKLEAWDIEIKFRHLAERHTNKIRAASLYFIFISCFSLVVMPDTSYANSYETLTPEQSTTSITEILKDKDFHKEKDINSWRLKDLEEKDDTTEGIPEWLISFVKFLELMFGNEDDNKKDFTISNLLEIVLWITLVFIVCYLIYRTLKYLDIISFSKTKTSSPATKTPDVLFGLNVRKDSIPADVTKQTLDLWEKGKHREAIGLLYRSTLSLLIHQFLFEFYHGYTEQECSNLVQKSENKLLREFVSQITSIWQQIAYAHRLPADQQIQSLCNQWVEVSKHEK
jgi:hypothetical protein